MAHDHTLSASVQAQPVVAHALRLHLIQFLHPVAHRLAAQLDIRLVQTAVDLVQVILTHRHRALGLLLTELGGYLLSPAQAPAGAKRISNLIHATDWSSDDIDATFRSRRAPGYTNPAPCLFHPPAAMLSARTEVLTTLRSPLTRTRRPRCRSRERHQTRPSPRPGL